MPNKRVAKRASAKPTRVVGRELARSLSVSAVLFQAQSLLQGLEVFTESDYPPQTLTIAHLLKILARRAFTELFHINPAVSMSPAAEARVRDLGSIVHALHSYLRYLQASDPLRTPPGIQQAISLLIASHVGVALNCNSDQINVLVRPQWTYNLKYVDIIHQFEDDADCVLAYALDPNGTLGAYGAQELIEALWKADGASDDVLGQIPREVLKKLPEKMPKHVAVLSFAGLDRDDVLLYPLLAHELGHFLDFASEDSDKPSTDSATRLNLPTIKELKEAGLKTEEHVSLAHKIGICLREVTADLLAVRMAGLGYLFAFNEFFKTLGPWSAALVNPESGYPGFGLRLKLIFDELERSEAGICATAELENLLSGWHLPGKRILVDYIEHLRDRVSSLTIPPNAKKPKTISQFIENTLTRAIPAIQNLAREIIPPTKAAKVPKDILDMVDLLSNQIPPFQPPTRSQRSQGNFKSWSFHEILTAGWLYQLAIGEQRELGLAPRQRFKEYQGTCLLLLKALELNGARQSIEAIERQNEKREALPRSEGRTRIPRGWGVVSGPSIRAALDRKVSADRLVLCPDLGDESIESASRDLHLGHWFRISRRTSLPHIDIAYSAGRAQARCHGQSELFVPDGSTFVLQPGDFGLAASLEYICLPSDMMAFVEGKSSLGRAGLLIATATQVAPGFKGCIVLELFNAGTVPIILRPAMRVAQLVLVSTDMKLPNDWLYSGTFQVQIKP